MGRLSFGPSMKRNHWWRSLGRLPAGCLADNTHRQSFSSSPAISHPSSTPLEPHITTHISFRISHLVSSRSLTPLEPHITARTSSGILHSLSSPSPAPLKPLEPHTTTHASQKMSQPTSQSTGRNFSSRIQKKKRSDRTSCKSYSARRPVTRSQTARLRHIEGNTASRATGWSKNKTWVAYFFDIHQSRTLTIDHTNGDRMRLIDNTCEIDE